MSPTITAPAIISIVFRGAVTPLELVGTDPKVSEQTPLTQYKAFACQHTTAEYGRVKRIRTRITVRIKCAVSSETHVAYVE